jgi:NTP pyrophosphatase (non-canonical NTP hydrolase)
MSDQNTTIDMLKQKVKKYIDARDWAQFHSPKNVSMDIIKEASELMEFFMWIESPESWQRLEQKRDTIKHEVADIAFGLINFCSLANIDLAQAMDEKIALNEKKYPIEKAKGKATKYTEL